MTTESLNVTIDGETLTVEIGTVAAPPGGGSSAWGGITGTLSDQTDLQAALDGKETAGAAATLAGALATVATSGAYADLSGKPTLGSAAAAATGDFATAAQGALADTAVQPAAIDSKLDDLSAGTADAIVTASADGTLLSRAAYTIASLLSAAWDRASHTGTQLASTISDFASAAIAAVTWSTITGKPSTFTPSAHASSHATAGSDPIAPGDIGAQATLVSGTNIKTINSTSLLGSGDIAISATPAGSSNELQRNSGGTFAGATGVTWASNQLLITAQAAGTCPAAIKLATSHTANGLEIQNSAGTVLALTDSAGVSRAASFRHITTANQAGLTFVSGYAQLIGYNGAVCLSIPLSGTGANAQDRLSLGPNYYTTDAGLNRVAAGIIGIRGASSSAGAAVSLIEQTAPSAPATDGVYIYAEDNGGGKTRLMALFATGAAQQIAIEP